MTFCFPISSLLPFDSPQDVFRPNNDGSSSKQHHYISSTPPVRPRRTNKAGAAFRKKMSVDASGAPNVVNHLGAAGGGGTNGAGAPLVFPASPVSSIQSSGENHPHNHHSSSAQQQQQQQQQPLQHSAIVNSAAAAASSSSMERQSFKRTHKRDMSAGTKTTMLWLKASEEYAEERRRRADLPPCVSADDVVDDILQEFDMVKRSNVDRDLAEISGLKLSDVQ